jgi:RimJ/RimL family protein N-acetyltransferase
LESYKIRGREKVSIESITSSDVDKIAKEANDIGIAMNVQNLGAFPYPYTIADAMAFLQSVNIDTNAAKGYTMRICGDNGEFAGLITIKIRTKNLDAEIGYWVGKPHRGKGYAKEALMLMLGFGFREIGVRHINAKAYGDNNASIAVLRRSGMKHEGILVSESFTTKYPEDYRIFMEMISEGKSIELIEKRLGVGKDIINSWNKRFVLKTDSGFDQNGGDLARDDTVFGMLASDYNYEGLNIEKVGGSV